MELKRTTKPADAIRRLIAGGAGFLAGEETCRYDHINHAGRRAYGWTLLRYLWDRDGDPRHIAEADRLAASILPNLQERDGVTIILPGLTVARNFSTNAIDTGIFADGFFDYLSMQPDAQPEAARIAQMVRSYSLSKIQGPFHIVNQILWCATGAARYADYVKDAEPGEAAECAAALRQLLDRFAASIRPDGLIPYSLSPHTPEYLGPSPYYHGRCIAFAWYVMEKAAIAHAPLTGKLLAATRYLARLYGPDGHKQMGFEAKRYYFNGPYEVASNAHDIYCFWRAFETGGEPAYVTLAGRALERLIAAQRADGGIASTPQHANIDWQCDTMRTGHLAWLARVPDSFLAHCLEAATDARPNDAGPAELSGLFANRPEDSLLIVPAGRGWHHVNLTATARNGFSGIHQTGLIAGNRAPLHAWLRPAPLHYRRLRPRRAPLRPLLQSLRHALFHARHILWHRRQPVLALNILLTETLGHVLSTAIFQRSERTAPLTGAAIGADSIAHALTLGGGGYAGDAPLRIGQRLIAWSDGGVRITDTIDQAVSLTLTLPAGWALRVNGRPHTGRRIKGPCNAEFTRPPAPDD